MKERIRLAYLPTPGCFAKDAHSAGLVQEQEAVV